MPQRRKDLVFTVLKRLQCGEIANDLHMTKGALYYYFPGKENLYEAVIEKEQNEFLRKLGADAQDCYG